MTFAIIPCRQKSTRFPNKVMHLIDGKPMLWRVYRNVVTCPWIDGVCLTYPLDDVGIRLKVDEYKIPHVCSYDDHPTGSDRCFEAAKRLGIKRGIVFNVQGDEPLIHHDHIRQILSVFDDNPTAEIVTLAYEMPDAGDRDTVKVQFDGTGRVYNFTRIDPCTPKYYGAVGIMAFRFYKLEQFSRLDQGERELAESIELLRALENGMDVYVGVTARPTIGVDIPSDVLKVEKALRGG